MGKIPGLPGQMEVARWKACQGRMGQGNRSPAARPLSAKESDVEVNRVDWIPNVDSQPDYTPSAPPEELVTGLYPSLDGLEEN